MGLVKFHNQRVLLIDIDPQGNASAALGIPIWELQTQLKDALQRKVDITEVIVPTDSGVDVVPSNLLLAEEEIPISGVPGREVLLKKAIATVDAEYDWILIDCPPNVGVFAINALMASEAVLVPVDMSYMGLLGIQGIERTLKLVADYKHHPIEIAGVLATRYDKRNNLSAEVLESLREHFGDKLCSSIIPETVRIREAPSHHQSIFEFDPRGAGAKAYKELSLEVLSWQ
ncbi:ParA family protein [Lyngbya sp. PCC 8106]|uniref:ParA family protein n=1 Tax=Lyngbya sp. (strain PCC 8106) TaxID=313612 RepID=UPI0000EA9B29|nr:ParA family protein [Lyngbya sp. PCC 8106]EAW35859.1 chromosome partitioning protein, membrane-associated ATPase [Lyngbya sp. PCC 8106]